LLLTVLACALPCAAQCAMCRASVANGENAAEMSHTINSAVLILFFPTIAIISGFVGLVLKYRHSKGGEMEDRSVTKDPKS
jgi:heme/copper-type cytochrome/quinol oxidase subunit 2